MKMATRQLKHKANRQLKQKANTQRTQKPTTLQITINPSCKPVPNGALARLSKTEANGEPSTVFWYAKTDSCISLPAGALIPDPPSVLQLDAGNYTIIYKVNPDYQRHIITYNVSCSRPCSTERNDDNGESIIIDP